MGRELSPAPRRVSPEPEVPTHRPVPLGEDEPVGPRPDYLAPGTVVGGYSIVNKLGEGGFGAVYLAEREGDHYALKFPLTTPDELSAADRDETLGRLNREIGTLLQLNHPAVISVVEAWRWPSPKSGFPVVVMPYVRGQVFRRFVRSTVPSLADYFARLLRPLAQGLEYIHSKNVIHRDIKSANILVTPQWEVKLLDFGISRSKSAATLTQRAGFMGTYTHIPPEVYAHIRSGGIERGEASPYTAQGDIYALGVVVYETLTSVIPRWYLTPDESSGGVPGQWYDNLLTTPLDEPSTLNPNIPPAVSAFMRRMLASEMGERFHSATHVIDAIDELLGEFGGDPTWTSPFSVPERVARPAAASGKVAPTTGKGRVPSKGPASGPKLIGAPPPPPPPTLDPTPPNLAFKAPPGGPASFVSPAASTRGVAPQAPQAEPNQELAQALRRTQAQVLASGTNRSNRLLWAGGLAIVGLLAAVLLLGPAQSQAPRSLLTATEPSPAATAVVVPVAAAPAEPVVRPLVDVSQEELAPLPAPAPAPVAVPSRKVTGSAAGGSADARAIDEELARNYGGVRPVVPPSGAPAPVAPPKPAGPAWLKTAEPVGDSPSAARTTIGVAMGAELPVRLMKPLDSRTVGSGPAIARLQRAYAPRGDVLLPSGAMLYGTATGTGAGRFNIHFTRLKLPDGSEVAVDALAYDAQDKKPGLKATGRVTQSGVQGPSVGAQVVKTAAGAALGRVAANDDLGSVAKTTAQAALNGAGSDSTNTSAGEALLLDAPFDFTLFISQSF